MKNQAYITLSIRLLPEEYEQLRKIARAESRFLSRQAAYWIRQCIREYPLPSEADSRLLPSAD